MTTEKVFIDRWMDEADEDVACFGNNAFADLVFLSVRRFSSVLGHLEPLE